MIKPLSGLFYFALRGLRGARGLADAVIAAGFLAAGFLAGTFLGAGLTSSATGAGFTAFGLDS